MAWIEGEIVIARPVDEVFDYAADQRNELDYNPRMARSEKVTSGPVGHGTVFRAEARSLGRAAPMRIVCTACQRPTLLASVTSMRQAEFRVTLTFDPVPAGTRMRWSEQVRMKGGLRLLTPLVTWLGRRQEQAIWTSMKRQLESGRAGRTPGKRPAD
jgi:Polyketide cyclase / dehydrase and lipid transport